LSDIFPFAEIVGSLYLLSSRDLARTNTFVPHGCDCDILLVHFCDLPVLSVMHTNQAWQL